MNYGSRYPLVSIILATYNGEEFLGDQLDSILGQSYPNIELLICDDNSSDGSHSISTLYAKRFKHIRALRNKTHLGLVKNFEKLLELANGEYISFCDQDDIWRRDKLSISIESLQRFDNSKPLLFHSDLVVVDEKLEVKYESFFEMRGYSFSDKKDISVALGRSGVMGNTVVINQKLRSLILPFPPMLWVHDYWVGLINEIYGKRVTCYEPLLKYRIHHKNSSLVMDRSRDQNRVNRIIAKLGSGALAPPFDEAKAIVSDKFRKISNTNLPFYDIQRDEVLRYLLSHYSVDDKDRYIILRFIEYLEFKKSRYYLIYLIFRYDFLKPSIFYRLKIACKILWRRR